MYLCCTSEVNIETDVAKRPFWNSYSKDDLDVIDNPNAGKTKDVGLENKTLFETMKCEKNRWDSFDKKWPLQFIDIGELVASGFFYLQSDDKVQCAFCKLILCSWKAGDKPLKEHIKLSPKCPLLMKANYATASVLRPLFPHSNDINSTLLHSNPSKPKNPRMIDLKMRLSTFKNWPLATIKVQDLAECGLYFTGVQDVVTCFYCGGSLSNWEPSDEPIVEHAKFYPNCNYLKIIQSRPVYKRLKSAGPIITVQGGGNVSSRQLKAEEILNSEIVERAKEIFPSSMVDDVVLRHLQRGVTFSSLHHLCEKLLEQDMNTKTKQQVQNGEDMKEVASTSAIRFDNKNTANDILLCKICMDSEREVVFQPCGHLISCEKCAALVTHCPLCRSLIGNRMRTFLS